MDETETVLEQPAESETELTNSHPGWYTDGLTDAEYAAGVRREAEPAEGETETE